MESSSVNSGLPTVPIWQAPTGSIAGPELCAAVANAGGVGAMGVTWTDRDVAAHWVRQVRAHTKGMFLVNFALAFEPKALSAVLDARPPIVSFSWGDPGRHAELVKSAGAKLAIQVTTGAAARKVLRHAPNFFICQGIEAGGHVEGTLPLPQALAEVLSAADGVPVIAAGGIATREDVQCVLDAGAAGAMLGTRFVACRESRAHPEYKRLLIESTATELTTCFSDGWPNAKHRVLANPTLEMWKRAGEPEAPDRPGEADSLALMGSVPILRYEDTAPRVDMEGNIGEMCLYAGTGVGKIGDVPSAAELVERLSPS